jgi:methionyl-tRNA formyltransferase
MKKSGPRVVFLGDRKSEFSNRLFAILLQTTACVVGVVDSPPRTDRSANRIRKAILPNGAADFMDYAQQLHLPHRRPRSVNSRQCRLWLRRLSPELMISAGFFGILHGETLAITTLPPVNFHASLLPAFQGKHPVARALAQGAKQTGITVHTMTEEIDNGEIIYQHTVAILPDDTIDNLYDRIIQAAVPLMELLVKDTQNGYCKP